MTIPDVALVTKHITELLTGDLAIILIGSAARNRREPESDIDLLVIAPEKPNIRPAFSGFHIQIATEKNFIENLCFGEDFEAWCVRLGTAQHDSGIWKRIVAHPCASNWPNWKLKIRHGTRRLFFASALLEIGDQDAAREELLYAVGHIGRALLLREHMFPLSRPELAEQLRELDFGRLAVIHETLRAGRQPTLSLLRQAMLYAKRLLILLDKSEFSAAAKDYAEYRRAKRYTASVKKATPSS